jgi:DNA-3-methyladenine glycosylase
LADGSEPGEPAPFYDGEVNPRNQPDAEPEENRLDRDFFARAPDVVARALIGTLMIVRDTRMRTARILETEAYDGLNDPASHAFRGPTPRSAIMFGPAGFVYVYLSYGIHWCMNIVTGEDGVASAVLLRAARVLDVTDDEDSPGVLLRGPGNLTRGLGITGADNGLDCCSVPSQRISFVAATAHVDPLAIGQSRRIGLTKGQERLSRYFLRPEIPK